MNQNDKSENKIEGSTDFKKIGVRRNKYGNRKPKKIQAKWMILSVLLWVFIFGVLLSFVYYAWQTSPIDKHNEELIYFTINEGDSSEEIAKTLLESGLIRNTNIFKIYSKIKNENHFVEGRYKAAKNNSFKEIVDMIIEGRIDNSFVIFQILEGKNIRHIAKKANEEFEINEEEFINTINDSKYLDSLIDKYWFLTNAIKNKEIYYALEGYLFPDTYHFDRESTDSKLIIQTMLNRTEEILEPYKSQYIDINGKMKKDLKIMPIHQVLTLASCAELEGAGEEYRQEIVGVFINRLDNGMSMGSDPTTYYAIKVDISERDVTMAEIMLENPYNTRGPNMIGKVPIGPICSPSEESIKATFNYKKTENFFFVSDKNGKMYFTENEMQHDAKIEELIEAGLWYIHEE